MSDEMDEVADASPSTAMAILEGVSGVPKDVAIRFMDIVARGISTIYSPLGTVLKATADRVASQQDTSALVSRHKALSQISHDVDLQLLNKLVDNFDSLQPKERLKYTEDLLKSSKISQTISREKRFAQNRESIATKSLKFLPQNTKFGDVSQDWIDSFFRCGEIVSDTHMQELWAQILAGKIENPSSFSKKTLRQIQDLTEDQARLFVKFCAVVFYVDDSLVSIRLDNNTDRYLNFAQINFDELLVLVEFGLVSLSAKTFKTEVGSRFSYFNQSFQATREFTFRGNPLTTVGRELFPIVERKKSDAYFNEVRGLFDDKIGPTEKAGEK